MSVDRAAHPAMFDLRVIIGRRQHGVDVEGGYPLQRHDDGLRTDEPRMMMVIPALKRPRQRVVKGRVQLVRALPAVGQAAHRHQPADL